MEFEEILYTNHAVKQMFQRNISSIEVLEVLHKGLVIMEYTDDKPFPSKLLFSVINLRPLHVVCSYDIKGKTIIVITVYEPSLEIWTEDYKTRKK